MKELGAFAVQNFQWIVVAICFFLAFNGIVRKRATWNWPGPLGDFFQSRHLGERQSVFVGWMFLVAGTIAIFSEVGGILALLVVFLLTWFIGVFWPQRP